jgi:hypothetical protein
MLRPDYERTFKQLISEYAPSILLPRSVHLDLNRRGMEQAQFDEVRFSPRFRCMGTTVIEWLESPIGMPLQFPTTQGVVRNVSRTGFSVLMDRQWFPEQVARLYFPIAIAKVRVIRARKLGLRCYDIGVNVFEYQQD